jgi:hypothetical protein
MPTTIRLAKIVSTGPLRTCQFMQGAYHNLVNLGYRTYSNRPFASTHNQDPVDFSLNGLNGRNQPDAVLIPSNLEVGHCRIAAMQLKSSADRIEPIDPPNSKPTH